MKFNNTLKQLSQTNNSNGREIDGIIVTKYDTVDNKVGAIISLAYSSGK